MTIMIKYICTYDICTMEVTNPVVYMFYAYMIILINVSVLTNIKRTKYHYLTVVTLSVNRNDDESDDND